MEKKPKFETEYKTSKNLTGIDGFGMQHDGLRVIKTSDRLTPKEVTNARRQIRRKLNEKLDPQASGTVLYKRRKTNS